MREIASSRAAPGSEREADLQLHGPHGLGAVDRTEPGIARRAPVRIQLPVRQILRVADGLVGRAVQLELSHAAVVDHRVQRVEDVGAQLELPGAPEPDVARNGEVERPIGTADQVVPAGLETEAARLRSGERIDVELRVLIARTAAAGSPVMRTIAG